jgi:hypothetical protein
MGRGQPAHDHGIPARSRGTSSYIPAGSAPGIHPRDLPEPLGSTSSGGARDGALTTCSSPPGMPGRTSAGPMAQHS